MNPPDGTNPVISVIVPVHNEAPRLERNFRSILAQENAPAFEVIYVDNGSTDKSYEMLSRMAIGQRNVRVVRLALRGTVGAARNAALSLSGGAIIANVDADCEVPVDWLSHYNLLHGSFAIVGFPNLPPPDLEYLHHRFCYVGTGQYPQRNLPHGCGALIRKDLALAAGGFQDIAMGEDTKLFAAITNSGARVVLLESPPIHILQKRVTLRQHLERYWQIGRQADPKSRLLYAGLLAGTVTGIVLAIMAWTVSPLLTAMALIITGGTYANPSRVRYYVQHFRFPSNKLVRVGCFSLIKVFETVAVIWGFVSSSLSGLRVRATRQEY
jgi:cellulose synthase/poly-beta-1,6-N-acetylglucosamine synthase-like glycosyltransferase